MSRYILLVLCFAVLSNCAQDEAGESELSLASGKVERIENFDSQFIPSRDDGATVE